MTPVPTARLVAALVATAVMVIAALVAGTGTPAVAPAPSTTGVPIMTAPPAPATTTTSTVPETYPPTTTVPPGGPWKCPAAVILAVDAGFPADALALVDRIIYRESRCDPLALNDSYLDGGRDWSIGLWQVNTLGNLWPDRQALCGLTNRDELYDPATNTRCAFRIWERAGGFGPWGFS